MDVTEDTEYIFGNPENCVDDDSVAEFWIPVVQGNLTGSGSNYNWIDDRLGFDKQVVTDLKWGRSQPNGFELEQCVGSYLKKTDTGKHIIWFDMKCFDRVCSICKMPEVQEYYLRGQMLLNDRYYLNLGAQKSGTKIRFDGASSELIWHPLTKKTQLVDKGYGFEMNFEQDPFGLLTSTAKKHFTMIGAKTESLIFTQVLHDFSQHFFLIETKEVHFFNSANQGTNSLAGMGTAYPWTKGVMKEKIALMEVMSTVAF